MKEVTIFGWTVVMYKHYATLLLIPFILGLTFGFQDSQHHRSIYVPLATGLSSLVVFLNFPIIVVSLHSRPVYYDDLVIKDFHVETQPSIYDDTFRRKYQRIFRTVIAFTSSLLVVGTTELWYFRDTLFSDHESNTDVVKSFVVIGVIGGIMRIYYATTVFIGKCVIFVLKIMKRREQEHLHLETQQRIKEDLERESIPLETLNAACSQPTVSLKPSRMVDILS